MDRGLFCRVGRAMYGPDPLWHELLAIDLAVATRTLQRWASGTRDIPDLEVELMALMHERVRDIEAVIREVDAAPVDG